MRFKKEFNTIVIVGSWNNSILTNEWISRFLLPQEKNLEVEIPLTAFESMRISTEELRIFSTMGKLNFTILKHDDAVFRKIGDIAIKTSELLMHTPVRAFGINFAFECENTHEIDKIFFMKDNDDIISNEYSITNTQIKRTLTSKEYVLNLTVDQKDEIYTFDLNYHFDINSLTEFKDKFETEKIIELKQNSINLLSKIYKLELD